ncbi:MAG TPA: DUF748 domain-containing protein [Woeseiaceae bacterium]
MRRLAFAALIVVAVLVAARAALPVFAADYVNERIAALGDYRGHVQNIDVALIRGAYQLRGLTIVKRGAEGQEPFLSLPLADISVKWSALFHGELVGEIQMHGPVMRMVQGETARQTQLGEGVDWVAQVQKLFPFRFNRVEVLDGTVTFRAPGIEQNESLTIHDFEALLTNLTNMEERNVGNFAGFEISGRFGKDTPLSAKGRANPLAQQPTFDVNASLENAPLVDVNPWLREFLNVDAEKGVFSLYAELAAADGRFEGYVKPILEDPEIFRMDEPSDSALQKAWEALVGAVSGILENPEEEQVATRIPFAGELENPDAGLLAAGLSLLRNAFVAAFTHSLEGSVSLEDVQDDED